MLIRPGRRQVRLVAIVKSRSSEVSSQGSRRTSSLDSDGGRGEGEEGSEGWATAGLLCRFWLRDGRQGPPPCPTKVTRALRSPNPRDRNVSFSHRPIMKSTPLSLFSHREQIIRFTATWSRASINASTQGRQTLGAPCIPPTSIDISSVKP